jgi:GNAT superfamily N-acetyltransferase
MDRLTRPDGIRFRLATEADLPACEEIWRDAINGYSIPLGQHEIPPDNPSLRRLHAHTLATDPDGFWVAVRGADDADAELVIGFISAVRREPVWFLSMLFVRPGFQGGGLGRALLARALPGATEDLALATVTDAVQPISNGLYARLGMVPRAPMLNLVGRPIRPDALPPLPAGVAGRRFDRLGRIGGRRGLAVEIDALDREVLGYAHPREHDYLARAGRIGYAYRDASGTLVGYGYTSELGRVGPIAVREAALNAPITGDLLRAVTPRGASAIWVPGPAGPTTEALLRSGFRIEDFPVLLCWSRPFADFARYLPISPGLP